MNSTSKDIHFSDHFLCFTLDDKEYGVPMSWVKKLVLYKDWSLFESTPQYQDGVFLHHDQHIPLLDLRKFLRVKDRPKGSLASIIILEINGVVYGVIVDVIAETVNFEKNIIDFDDPFLSYLNTDFIYGIAQHAMSSVVLLRMDRIIAEQIRIIQESALASVI